MYKKASGYKLICAQVRAEKIFIGDKKVAVPEFVSFVKKQLITQIKDDKFMLFVTTDDSGVRKRFVSEFGADRVLSFNDSSSHFVYDFSWWWWPFGSLRPQVACQKNRNTMVDFLCLSECDMGVVSHSGFGVLGMWNRPVANREMYVYSSEKYVKTGLMTNQGLGFIKVEDLDSFHFAMDKGVVL
jgi:hypothetical protein